MTARFAPSKPGSKPIISTPCPCQECGPGPGIDYEELYRLRWATDHTRFTGRSQTVRSLPGRAV